MRREVPLVPPAAAEPLPDPDQVPRRGAAALRPHARARVHHEGRLLVPRRRARTPSASTSDMYDAYTRIFARCGLDVPRRSRPTPATSAARCRTSSRCSPSPARTRSSPATSCGYAANVEKAEVAPRRRPPARPAARSSAVATPGQADDRGGRARSSACRAERFVKTLVYVDRRRAGGRRWCAATTSCQRDQAASRRSARERSRWPTRRRSSR